MTIGAWVVLAVIAIVGICIAVFAWFYMHKELGLRTPVSVLSCCAILLITAIACGVFFWYRSSSASGQRALKDQQSNLNGGIERIVRVFDVNGHLIERYEGRFDVETDRQTYILFDDENGKRHIIYYTTGTVIIDEK